MSNSRPLSNYAWASISGAPPISEWIKLREETKRDSDEEVRKLELEEACRQNVVKEIGQQQAQVAQNQQDFDDLMKRLDGLKQQLEGSKQKLDGLKQELDTFASSEEHKDKLATIENRCENRLKEIDERAYSTFRSFVSHFNAPLSSTRVRLRVAGGLDC